MRETATSDAERFLALLRPIERDLERYCRRLIWEPQEAPDALQNAVMRAFAAFDRYHEDASFRAWMFKILTHEAFALNRKHARIARHEFQLEPEELEGLPFTGEPDLGKTQPPSPEALNEALEPAVAAGLKTLTETERAVLLLRAIGDLRYREISESLGIPLGSVMGNLARALHPASQLTERELIMKCDEVQRLQGPYVDSELDARTILEVEAHLKSCPDCARLLAEGRSLETRLKAALNQGPRTAAVWEQIEQCVTTAASSSQQSLPSHRVAQPAAPRAVWSALGEQLMAAWRRSRWAWAGLGAVWLVILVLNGSAQESDARVAAGQGAPSLSEMRFAWKQKQLLMADLAVTSEPAPAAKPAAAPSRPRSQRANETPNA